MSWELDKEEAKAFELLIARHVARTRKALIWPNGDGKDSAKDFILYMPCKVEVKCDKKAAETGNLFIEIHNVRQNAPSGIAQTKALTVFHFVPPSRLFSYEPAQMLDFAQRMLKEARARLVEGGDNNNSRGILIPIATVASLGPVKEEHIQL